jgi:hypothetical protein
MKSASRYPQLDGTLILPGSGGNLARVTCNALSSQTGHFLFSEQLQQLAAQFTNAGGVSSFSPTSAGAASNRRALMSAKSRPLPFSEVNHVAHVRLSLCETKFTTEAFS